MSGAHSMHTVPAFRLVKLVEANTATWNSVTAFHNGRIFASQGLNNFRSLSGEPLTLFAKPYNSGLLVAPRGIGERPLVTIADSQVVPSRITATFDYGNTFTVPVQPTNFNVPAVGASCLPIIHRLYKIGSTYYLFFTYSYVSGGVRTGAKLVTTTDFVTYSAATDITAATVTVGGGTFGLIELVGTTFVYMPANAIAIKYSTNGTTWSSSAQLGPYSSLLSDGDRLIDYDLFSSRYSTDGNIWTTFTPSGLSGGFLTWARKQGSHYFVASSGSIFRAAAFDGPFTSFSATGMTFSSPAILTAPTAMLYLDPATSDLYKLY